MALFMMSQAMYITNSRVSCGSDSINAIPSNSAKGTWSLTKLKEHKNNVIEIYRSQSYHFYGS